MRTEPLGRTDEFDRFRAPARRTGAGSHFQFDDVAPASSIVKNCNYLECSGDLQLGAMPNNEGALQRKPSETAREKRYEFPQGVKARLFLLPQKDSVAVTIINISKSGLCARTDDRLPATEELFLLLGKRRLAVTAVWSLPEADNGNATRYGFACMDQGADVVSAVSTAGLSLSNAIEKFRNVEEDFIDQFCANGVSVTVKKVGR